MSEQDWNFANEDEAKTEIRAAVQYLLRGANGSARADIVLEIIKVVRDVANGSLREPSDPFDEELPGG
jgi:hypothetical protein